MELLILAVGVGAGVTLVVFLVHFTGGSDAKRFSSPESALAACGAVYKDLAVSKAHLAIGGREALIFDGEHRILAYLKMLGANPVIRFLSDDEITQITVMENEIAVVVPGDGLAAPATVLLFDDRAVLGDVRSCATAKTLADV